MFLACLSVPLLLNTQILQHTVRGEIRDSAGAPVPQVQVLAMTAGRKTLSGDDGRFQLDSIPAGEERFLFRRLGFNAVELTVVVSQDQPVTVRMTPVPQELKAIVVRGRRSGVLGTVTDIDEQPIAGAEVTVLGGSVATTTDSLGHFSLPRVSAGTFMLMVRKRGYFASRHTVTLPVGEALETTLLLGRVPGGLSHRRVDRLAGFGGILDAAWDAHASRRIRCAGGNFAFIPREELSEQRALRLDLALPRAPSALARGFGPSELRGYAVYIDGQNGEGWPLSAIPADEVEAVEVYRRTTMGAPARIVPGSTTRSALAGTMCPSGTIWIWLR